MKKTSLGLIAFILLTTSLAMPCAADAAWVMIAEEQHVDLASCPEGLQLISVEAGDADLLVCAPKSKNQPAPESADAKKPSDEEGPLEGPKFN